VRALLQTIRREPALVAGFLQALLALLLAFGVPLTTEQTGAILALSAAVLAFVVRRKVTPTSDA
jgi:hypothetical protein